MIGNPRYGALGIWGMPYFVLFELAGPVIEFLGYVIVIAATLTGVLSLEIFALFALLAIGLGIVLSVAALALEELGFRRYPTERSMVRLFMYAIAENLGYRQLVSVWRVRALFDLSRGERRWGEMHRRGLGGIASRKA